MTRTQGSRGRTSSSPSGAGRSRGFTLVELMVAMVVSAIVVLGIFAFSSIQRSTASLHDRDVRVQQALEGAMWTLGEDVRASGLGFARMCTELRIWDAAGARLLNPGGPPDPSEAAIDPLTGEAYWVLRDGFQAHWRSEVATSLAGSAASSASPSSAADSFDVIVGEANYLDAMGVFTLGAPIDPSDTALSVVTSTALDDAHVDAVRQLFPPGSFIAIARAPATGEMTFRADRHGQCVLLQVTGDIESTAAGQWTIPIAGGGEFGFNANLAALLDDTNGTPTCPDGGSTCDDWVPEQINAAGAIVMPLGRLRWSRYAIDYTVPQMPYLVRFDIIGMAEGDPDDLGGVNYPHCAAGECPAPQLHLPGGEESPPAVAIGPMIEDMQVAVGCDGWTADAATNADFPLPVPDDAYAEVGPAGGATPNLPNISVDENSTASGDRDRDEWLGNAQVEAWAPDCVWYGTAEYNRDAWATVESAESPPPAFRMSPQTVRVSLVGSAESPEQAGGLAIADLVAVEDRPPIESPVGVRQRFSLTERFSPENLRWRDTTIE